MAHIRKSVIMKEVPRALVNFNEKRPSVELGTDSSVEDELDMEANKS